MASYVIFERANGFHNTQGRPDQPATTSFSRVGDCGTVQGTQLDPYRDRDAPAGVAQRPRASAL